MKHIFSAAILLLTVVLFSCRKDNITIPNQQNLPEASIAKDMGNQFHAPAINMHIGSFIIDGRDETIHYNLYDFEVNENLITATSGLFTIKGKWYRTKENIIMYFDVSTLPDIIAYFFTNLNSENWVIVRETENDIYLECYDNKVHRELRFDILK